MGARPIACAVVVLALGCGQAPPPCDPARYAVTLGECAARVQTECVDRGIPESDCAVLAECDRRIEEACPE